MNVLIFDTQLFANISNTKANTLLTGTAYADTLKNTASKVTIQGKAGNDSIRNSGVNAYIDGGAGNDKITITSAATKNTIIGGTGNDSIYSSVTSGVLYKYAKGDGNDYISGWTAKDTLTITGGAFKTSTTGNNVVVSVTGGAKITLAGAKGKEININNAGKNISNTKASTVITGNAYADTLKNTASKVTIQANSGNDSIRNSGVNAYIDGGAGNDKITITSAATKNTVIGGTGNDSIYSSVTSGVLYKYAKGDGNDYISGWTAKDTLTITGGAFKTSTTGNNVVVSITGGSKITLVGAKGKTVNINNAGKNISNTKTSTVITGNAYADTLKNTASKVTIQANSGNDSIRNSGVNAYIDGGAGNDKITITSAATKNTIIGGTGNDSIYSSVTSGVLYKYAKGDGNDYISGWTAKDTLTITGGAFKTSTTGNNVIVSITGGAKITLAGAKGKSININPTFGKSISNTKSSTLVSGSTYADTLKNTASNVSVYGYGGADSIYNTGNDFVEIYAGDGNDTIFNNGGGTFSHLDGGVGNDSIFSVSETFSAIIGGAGNDTIVCNNYTGTSVSGGDGNDLIKFGGNVWNTINPGKGNDTVISTDEKGVMYIYTKGDGNDSIVGWNSHDSMSIVGGAFKTSTVGNNVKISIAGGNTITLSGAKGKALNIYPYNPAITQQEAIKKFMGSLDVTNNSGVVALNEAVSKASGGYFTTIQQVIAAMVKDCKEIGSANDFLLNKCGINLDNEDTGAITGFDAGGSNYQKTAESIIPEEGNLDDDFLSHPFNGAYINGLGIHLRKLTNSEPEEMAYEELDSDIKKFVWHSMYKWWVGGALNLISESYGDNFSFNSNSSATVKDIYFGFVNDGIASTEQHFSWETGDTTKLILRLNVADFSNTDFSNSNGISNDGSSAYLDRTLAHEFTHAVMDANIKYTWLLPLFIMEGAAELVIGTDDYEDKRSEMLNLASNDSLLSNALSLTQNNGYEYSAGYMFFRYLAKQSSEHYGETYSGMIDEIVGISLKDGVLTATSEFNDNVIDLTQYAPDVREVDASEVNVDIEIFGNEYADSIQTGAGADTIYANTGDDTINAGGGKNIIFGDAGKDIFIHSTGDDFIADYSAGEDKIKLTQGNILNASISGSNVIFTLDKGSITIKDGKDTDITIVNQDGTTILFSDNNFVTDTANIDSVTEITDTNYSVGNVSSVTSYDIFTQDKFLVTTSYEQNTRA